MRIAVGRVEVCSGCAKRLAILGGRNAYVRSKRWPVMSSKVRHLRQRGWRIDRLAEHFDITPRHVKRLLSH